MSVMFGGTVVFESFLFPVKVLSQAIKGFLVATQGITLNEKDVLRYCSGIFESFMIPKYVVFLEELPKSSHGKIDKSALKQATLPA